MAPNVDPEIRVSVAVGFTVVLVLIGCSKQLNLMMYCSTRLHPGGIKIVNEIMLYIYLL